MPKMLNMLLDGIARPTVAANATVTMPRSSVRAGDARKRPASMAKGLYAGLGELGDEAPSAMARPETAKLKLARGEGPLGV